VSSTGHLTVLEKLMGYQIDDPDITAFTAIIQSGAVLATLLFFRRDLWRFLTALVRGVLTPAERKDLVRIVAAWFRGLFSAAGRQDPDWRFAWAVILGSIPIGIVGLAFQDTVEHTLRSLWFIAGALIVWSGAMAFADHAATQVRHEDDVTWKDTLIVGIVQCLALIPGVSRSGAKMSAGLLRDLDRVTVTKLSFFLSIPALFGATVLQVHDYSGQIADGVGWVNTGTATLVSFVVGYAAVAWLLRFISRHSYSVFIAYRIVLGALLAVLLATHTISAK
jgi:undecaprenyl-diphosphatase